MGAYKYIIRYYRPNCTYRWFRLYLDLDATDPSKHDVKEQAIWTLANIVGDSVEQRASHLVISSAALPCLISIVEGITETTRESTLENIASIDSSMFKIRPHPDDQVTLQVLPQLTKLLAMKQRIVELISHICWAVSYISEGADHRIQFIIEFRFLKR